MAQAEAQAAPEQAQADPATPAKSSNVRLILLVMVLTLSVAAGGGYLLLGDRIALVGEDHSAPPVPTYLSLSPAFVVNLEDDRTMRFLQVEVDIMAYEQAAIDAVNEHQPIIRNNLLLIFGSQSFADLETRESKEALQTRVLDEINNILEQRADGVRIREVYFTSFVMQ